MNKSGNNPNKSVQIVCTPADFLDALEDRFGRMSFDLASDSDNAIRGLPTYTPEDNALERLWPTNGNNFLNPPFRQIGEFLEKAHSETQRPVHSPVFSLVLASIGSGWYYNHVCGKALVVPLKGRLTFVGHDKPFPKDLILVIYGLHGLIGMQPPWDWKRQLIRSIQ